MFSLSVALFLKSSNVVVLDSNLASVVPSLGYFFYFFYFFFRFCLYLTY